MLKFFRLPFATTGDKTAVPDAVDSNGNVSYSQGYGFDYQRQKTDPAAKNIERDKMNQVFFDMTTAIAELQSQGVPDFITTALNGGAAYSYEKYAIARYGGAVYMSLEAANTALPTDSTKWALLNPGSKAGRSFVSAGTTFSAAHAGKLLVASGTGAYNLPADSSVLPGTELLLFNTGASAILTVNRAGSDTIQVNSTTVTSLTVLEGEFVHLVSNGVGSWSAFGSATLKYAASFGSSLAASGYQKLPSGLIIQWGNLNITASATDTTWTFPIAFPNASLSAQALLNQTGVTGATGVSCGTGLGASAKTSAVFRLNGASYPASIIVMSIGY